jgi:heme exporter protein C
MMKTVFFFFFCLVLLWGSFLVSSQVDVLQGEVYKILYIHVPNALCAFFSSFLLFLSSLFILLGKKKKFLPYAKASADIGFIFTLLTLVTGSIWGKPTWGTWWTWDARLTTTFLLAILYGAYHFLWQVAETTEKRMKICSVIGILIFADIPIIYKSVSWWRTLHQPPSLFVASSSPMSSSIYWPLVVSITLTLLFSLSLIVRRAQNLKLAETLEEKAMKSSFS